MMMGASEQGMPAGQRMPTEQRMNSYSMPAENAGVGIRYRDPIPAGASKGMEPNEDGLARLRSQIMAKESGGRRYDKEGNLLTSSKGALGEMQVMPATARDPGFGIRPARDNSPDELRRVGDEYAGVLLNRYKDPIVAMIAYNMGPGATDKWLAAGADPKKLPKETQGYIRNVTLAEGGEVKRFQSGGSSDLSGFEEDLTKFNEAIMPDLRKVPEYFRGFGDYFTKPRIRSTDKKRLDEIARGQGVFPEGSPALPGYVPPPTVETPSEIGVAGLTPDEMIAGSTRAGTLAAMMKDTTSGLPLPETKKAEPAKSRLDAFLEQQASSREELAEQRKQDKNMALLAAGLGMLGGTSRYAFENVGKGGLAGVQYLSEANKQRAAEKAALDKSQVTAMRYQDLADIAKGGGERTLGLRQAELNRKIREDNMDAIARLEKNSLAKATAALKSQGLLGTDLNDPKTQQMLTEWINNDLANNKAYNKLYVDTFGYAFDAGTPVQSGTGKRVFDSKGKEIK